MSMRGRDERDRWRERKMIKRSGGRMTSSTGTPLASAKEINGLCLSVPSTLQSPTLCASTSVSMWMSATDTHTTQTFHKLAVVNHRNTVEVITNWVLGNQCPVCMCPVYIALKRNVRFMSLNIFTKNIFLLYIITCNVILFNIFCCSSKNIERNHQWAFTRK